MQVQQEQQSNTMARQPMIYDAPHNDPYAPIPLIKICMPPKPTEREASDTDTKMNIGTFNLSCLAQDSLLPTSKLPFAWKLYEMLETVRRNKIDLGVVSWVDNGNAFKVHDLDKFVNDIVPTYFKQTKYKSFQRQLYFYGFQRVTAQAAAAQAVASSSTHGKQTLGSYRHPMFIRGNKTLCLSMVPKKNSNSKSNESIKTSKTKRSGSVVAARKTQTKTKKPKQQKPQQSEIISRCGPRMVSFEELPEDDDADNIDPIPIVGIGRSSSKTTTASATVIDIDIDADPIPFVVPRRVDNNNKKVVAAVIANNDDSTTHVRSRQQNQLLKLQQEQFYRSVGVNPPAQQQQQQQPPQRQMMQPPPQRQMMQQQQPVQRQMMQQQPPPQQRQMQQPGQFYQTQYRHHQRQQQQQQQRRDHEKACCVFGGKTFHFL